ncbi:MAG: VOC family protein [Pseudomonadota bacterium]
MALTSSIPVLRAADYPATRDMLLALGFEIAEEGGDPPRFGIFRKDAATVFVDAWHGADATPAPCWRAYFHTDDVLAVAERARAAGLPTEGPVETVYAMREVTVTDPDGNRLCFGQDMP